MERAWRHAVLLSALDPASPGQNVSLVCSEEQYARWGEACDRAGINSLNRWACTVLNVAAGASELHTQLGRVRPLLRD